MVNSCLTLPAGRYVVDGEEEGGGSVRERGGGGGEGEGGVVRYKPILGHGGVDSDSRRVAKKKSAGANSNLNARLTATTG